MSPRVTGRVGRGNPAGAPAAGLQAESLLYAATIGSVQDLAGDKLGRELSADEIEWIAQRLTIAAGETLDTLVGSLPSAPNPSDQREQLKAIILFADDLIRSEGSTTSSYFDRWCRIHDTAQELLDLLDGERLEGVDGLVEKWSRLATAELQTYYHIDEEGGAA
jgi:hypothetical protein